MNQFSERKYILGALVLLTGLVFIVRLFAMQVLDSSYKLSAENNSRREVIQYPARGLIYDRDGNLLVSNQAAYDLMVIPAQLQVFDTIDFCSILNISPVTVDSLILKARRFNYYAPSIFLKQVPAEISAVLQEKLFKFPGFFVQIRTLRRYSLDIAAHMLGYVGEVDRKIIENNDYYKMGDYIGISGVEKTYEDILRGKKGSKSFMVDVHNRVTNSWQEGRHDVSTVLGSDIVLSIDAGLQEYGEKLMNGFSGSVVAIEPSSGEILTLLTVPSYDPNLLVGRGLSNNFRSLSQDTLKPLFNRAVAASYPPGSTFKVMNGMIGLQEGVITPETEFYCNSGYYNRGIRVGCHNHYSPLDFRESIQNSCNAYYCHVFGKILEDKKYTRTDSAFNNWRRHVASFGLGNYLGSDIPGELRGLVPVSTYYNKYYGIGRWNYLTVISLSIGQGELGITPLQMTNMVAAIANRGYYFTPHILKNVKGTEGIDKKFIVKHQTSIDAEIFEIVIDGMELAVNGGAGSTARIAKIPDIAVCGKTGTAQNPFGEDHSIFIAFAPRENPKIAISVYVENTGFGATWAAPVASLMIEKYLKGEISRPWLEDHIMNSPKKFNRTK